MSKRKTALNSAIKQIDELLLLDRENLSREWICKDAVMHVLQSLLETERKDIIDAWDDGLNKGYTGNKGDAADYFTSKYESNG